MQKMIAAACLVLSLALCLALAGCSGGGGNPSPNGTPTSGGGGYSVGPALMHGLIVDLETALQAFRHTLPLR